MIVRPATLTDWEAILTLIRAFPDVLMQEHLPEPEEFFVAIDPSTPSTDSGQAGSGQVIACCALEVYSKRLAEVRSLAVAREHHGKGIASALIEACLARAKELDVYEVLTIS